MSTAQPQQNFEMWGLIERLYPICRSITGAGVRQTLDVLSEHLPITIERVASGTRVCDWTVPPEWNIRDAWIKDLAGNRVVDFGQHNLHVVSYSTPVRTRLSREELEPHLHSLPEQPDLIPYRTSYYNESWGFCVSQRQRESLTDAEYDVCIDASKEPGHLHYGELLVPGESEDEVLISTHVCHPSLANDNLSGIAISVRLARELLHGGKPRLSYRFLYAPGTIGAITWLERNRERAGRVKHGLTLVCLGDSHPITYKRTLSGASAIDRIVERVLADSGEPHEVIDFFPYGYDERQYNSPGFRIAVGSLMRGRHGEFPEYHTSADNLTFVSKDSLERSYIICRKIVDALERERFYYNQSPHGEPQLGTRGLYRAIGGESDPSDLSFAFLWILTLSDGNHSLADVADRAGMSLDVISRAAQLLTDHGLLAETPPS